MSRINSYTSELGISLLEYVIITVVLGFVVFGVYQQITPKSTTFYSDVASGFNVVYPKGYWSS